MTKRASKLAESGLHAYDAFTGSGADDTLTGTSANDTFDLTGGGADTASGAEGNDVFTFGATYTAADHVDGGLGYDKIVLQGNYAAQVALAADSIVGVDQFTLLDGGSATSASSSSTPTSPRAPRWRSTPRA